MQEIISFILPFDESLETYLKTRYPKHHSFEILSKSLDARMANKGKKPRYNFRVRINHQAKKENSKYDFPKLGELKNKPIIIGAGPAGLFCALRLAEYGISSLIIERGERAHKRMIKISKFWRYGEFDQDNNVCFGEGGAGLFSDGKLITRIKSPFIQYVMDKLVEFGAPKDTAYLTNPHLGSNKIRLLINKISDYLLHKNCEILYNTRVDELVYENNSVVGVKLNNSKILYSDNIILASGHSAKEIYQHLQNNNVAMQAKDFAVGVRIEHPRETIDKIQHGDFHESPILGAAKYRLSYHNAQSEKGTYSFCMCPGGYVLSSGTDANGLVVNGMSNYARNSRWSNSALVVTVKAGDDFSTQDVLAGHDFQQMIEQAAYTASVENSNGRSVPFQSVDDFLKDQLKIKEDEIKTSCPSGIFAHPLKNIFPEFILGHLKEALEKFDQKLPGFISKKAVLIAPETRTSAPVTITRDKITLESISHSGLYPCGEGAGYAGGITSAAVDGIKIAHAILKKEKDFE